MKKILITGGNGFVGSHLIPQLADAYSIINFDKEEKTSQFPQISNHKGDLIKLDHLLNIKEDLDGIIHLGGISRVSDAEKDPLKCMNVNVMGAMNILELARKSSIPPWIVMGS